MIEKDLSDLLNINEPPHATPTPTDNISNDFEVLEEIPPEISTESEKHILEPEPLLSNTNRLFFSLKIDGPLELKHQQKLKDLLEEFQIRTDLLTIPLEEGKVYLPKLSEYQVMRIVHALQTSAAQFRMFLEQEEVPLPPSTPSIIEHNHHPAHLIPIFTQKTTPSCDLMDTVFASYYLKCMQVEVENSVEFETAVEKIKNELKFKAYVLNADLVAHFSLQLQRLSFAYEYRLIGSGAAAKFSSSENSDSTKQ